MSLRDEIESCVLTFSFHADERPTPYKICTNEIIKKIEKRIDELENNVDINKGSWYNGYWNALETVKEMLK